MSTEWTYREVPIRFQLSDKTLFAHKISLQVREIGLIDEIAAVADPRPPTEPMNSESQGFMVRSLPVIAALPRLERTGDYLRYVPTQYRRYYIDLRQSFADYKQQFSSKTRSTILRKVKKFAEHSGGDTLWKVYKTADEIADFFRLARALSAKTYQAKLLDAGLPESEAFLSSAQTLAAEGRVRAFILFDGARPVSYLYCPAQREVLIYQYLGYDPEYTKLSVGTVLQWLALQHLFEERAFHLFDFTEGQSEHKRLFATHSIQCANVCFIRANMRNRILLKSQMTIDRLSMVAGEILNRWGIKASVKRLLRFGTF
jgi:CelD/BcsL family acetyltransferase involved in cellulose biosynthesis